MHVFIILQQFFMWAVIVNVILFAITALFVMLAPETVYKTQRKFVPLNRKNFNIVLYSFLGFYKIMIIIFCVTPYVVLLIIS